MNKEITVITKLYSQPGTDNTDSTLAAGFGRARELGIKRALVATTSGSTAVKAAELNPDFSIIAVTHSTGFKAPDAQELTVENRQKLEAAGVKILTCQHALGGVNRAIRRKFETYQVDEFIASVLRIQGEGFKVVCEISLMSADAGRVRTDEPVLVIAGSSRGCDTAVIIKPANAQDFFALKILEIICLPAPLHPLFQ